METKPKSMCIFLNPSDIFLQILHFMQMNSLQQSKNKETKKKKRKKKKEKNKETKNTSPFESITQKFSYLLSSFFFPSFLFFFNRELSCHTFKSRLQDSSGFRSLSVLAVKELRYLTLLNSIIVNNPSTGAHISPATHEVVVPGAAVCTTTNCSSGITTVFTSLKNNNKWSNSTESHISSKTAKAAARITSAMWRGTRYGFYLRVARGAT